jgi:hypothetical protein
VAVVKVVYIRDDTTGSGMACGEGAAYSFQTAARLISQGVCRVDDSEPDKEALAAEVTKYRKPARNAFWLKPLLSARYWRSGPGAFK